MEPIGRWRPAASALPPNFDPYGTHGTPNTDPGREDSLRGRFGIPESACQPEPYKVHNNVSEKRKSGRKVVEAEFFETDGGNKPVRDFLLVWMRLIESRLDPTFKSSK